VTWLWLALLLPVALVVAGALGTLGFLAVSHAFFAGVHQSQGRPIPIGRPLPLLGYWAREAWAFAVMSTWFLTSGPAGVRAPKTTAIGPSVLLVHGFLGSPANFWGVRRALNSRGLHAMSLSLGRPFRPIESYADHLAEDLKAAIALDEDGHGVDVVAHSMGGIVMRRVLRDHPELRAGVRRLVTVGTPHSGTERARGFTVGVEADQMLPGAPFLEDLWRPDDGGPDVRTFGARQDYVVFPAETTALDGASAHALFEAEGHAGMLVHPRSVAAIVDAVCGDDA
jgi:pimeloyl-ACP methyl ester carboxylesterase